MFRRLFSPHLPTNDRLGNVTVKNVKPSEANLICCSIATSFARQRSKNSTDAIGYTSAVLGPSPTKPGEVNVLCAAYDYGAVPAPAPKSSSAGTTGPLPPFPTPPPPPPPCASFDSFEKCPATGRCFWRGDSACSGCCDAPPLACGSNAPGPHSDNAPVCVSVILNTTLLGAATLQSTKAGGGAEVAVPAPEAFGRPAGGGPRVAYFSLHDREYFGNHTLIPWSYAATWTMPCVVGPRCPKEAIYAVGVTVTAGAGVLDLSLSVGGNLTFGGNWREDPFVATGVVNDKHVARALELALRSGSSGTDARPRPKVRARVARGRASSSTAEADGAAAAAGSAAAAPLPGGVGEAYGYPDGIVGGLIVEGPFPYKNGPPVWNGDYGKNPWDAYGMIAAPGKLGADGKTCEAVPADSPFAASTTVRPLPLTNGEKFCLLACNLTDVEATGVDPCHIGSLTAPPVSHSVMSCFDLGPGTMGGGGGACGYNCTAFAGKDMTPCTKANVGTCSVYCDSRNFPAEG